MYDKMCHYINNVKSFPEEFKLKKQDLCEQVQNLNLSEDHKATPKKKRSYKKMII